MEENFIPSENISENQENAEQYFELLAAKNNMKKCFNRIGWAVFAAMAVWVGLVFAITLAAVILDAFKETLSFSALDFYNRYLFIFNEVTLLIGILVGMLILSRVPKVVPGNEMPTFGHFFQILSICFAVGYVTNIISNIFLVFWNIISGIQVDNDVMEAISSVDPIQMILMVGIIGPILEEFFFRKLLIDRIRPYGELPAILVTAFLFSLFHQNVVQFLYTFGVGILLGYLYYRTGNFVVTAILHMSFNLISGVIPTLLLPNLLDFSEEMISLSEIYAENDEALLKGMIAALEQYGTSLILYGIYALVILTLNIAGIVFFFLKFKKYRACKGRYAITPSEKMKAIFLNPGMIVCICFLGILTVSSLFL